METPESIVADALGEEPVVEQDPLEDEYARYLLNDVLQRDRLPALEIALMELALWDLHVHRDEVEQLMEEDRDRTVVKLHRAMAKTFYRLQKSGKVVDLDVVRKYLGTKEEISKAKFITIAEYERRDGTVVPEHRRRLPEDVSRRSLEELKEIAAEVKRSEVEPSENWLRTLSPNKKERYERRLERSKQVLAEAPQFMFDTQRERTAARQASEEAERQILREERRVEDAAYQENAQRDRKERKVEDAAYSENRQRDRDKKADKLYSTYFNDNITAAGKDILKETTWGGRVSAAADFVFTKVSDKTATVKFAARAIRDYGPIAGMRMANAYMRYGGYDVPMRIQGDAVVTELGDVLPDAVSAQESRGWAISALMSRLPRARTYEAKSEPPSEGFIIDGDGNILVHAVGRGKDHYLPFNTRHLKKLKNTDRVEFVRSRMVGGPTQEDLHAAMMMGVDRLTVVSNSGVFTVDFTQRSHGIKLEHFQVLSRYQDILDEYEDSKLQGKKQGVLDGQGYMRALQSISDEFPLHINYESEKQTEGAWFDQHDYVQPKDRLMDQLRSLFEVEGYKDGKKVQSSQDRHATFSQGGTPPGMLGGKTWRTAFKDATARAPGGEDPVQFNIDWLNRVIDDYDRRNVRPPSDLVSERDAWVSRRDSRAGVTQSPADQQKIDLVAQRLKNMTALDELPVGSVVESRVTPTSASMSSDQKQWMSETTKKYQRATKFMNNQQLNLGSVRDRAGAEDLLEEVENTIEGWERAKSGPWSYDDIYDNFANSIEDLFDR